MVAQVPNETHRRAHRTRIVCPGYTADWLAQLHPIVPMPASATCVTVAPIKCRVFAVNW